MGWKEKHQKFEDKVDRMLFTAAKFSYTGIALFVFVIVALYFILKF